MKRENEGYSVTKIFRMTREQARKLEKRALKTGGTQSDVVRGMIDRLRVQ